MAINLRAQRKMVSGDREIIAILNSVEKRVARKQMRGALKNAATTVILPEAKARAPYDEGELEASLIVRALKRSRSQFGYEVRTRDEDDPVGSKQEFGTKRHRPQSFLRAAGYGNENRIRSMVVADLTKSIKELPVSPIR